jgi:flagellar export protein FliJ
MPRFAALFSLYQSQEDEARRAIGNAERRRADLTIERERTAAARVAAASSVSAALHEQYLAWWQSVELRLIALDQDLAKAEHALGEARVALIAAHRRTTTIAKLRELDQAADNARAERRRQRANDEFASRQRHAV